jgi:phosphopentomutase
MSRAVLLVLDSFGIGAAADAAQFGDVGANTLLHIAQACARGEADNALREGLLHLPQLSRLGLGHAAALSCGEFPPGLSAAVEVTGAYGYARELSSGKDTPSGHWEIAGVPVLFDWGYFPQHQDSFPPPLLEALIHRGQLGGILGNCHASGTRILEQLGDAHLRSGQPIVYTSADSVLQIAAHEMHFGLERLYALCEIARELCDPYDIGRVIARPFLGDGPANYRRTGNRRDYAVPPPAPTRYSQWARSAISSPTAALPGCTRPTATMPCSTPPCAPSPRRRHAAWCSAISSTSTCSTVTAATSPATPQRWKPSTDACPNCWCNCAPTTCC